MSSVLVSVCVITYNHCNYIRQCLDGILMQQTSFSFEIIINDDCSTDGTTEIIKEYVTKYPDIIRPIFHEENQYSKGVRGMFANFCFPRAIGKYIALCEGDDYWTDSLKLQRQVDFLNKYPKYILTSHAFDTQLSSSGEIMRSADISGFSYSITNYVKGEWCCSTLSVVFRASALENINYPITMDVVLFYALLKQGDGYCLKENMAIYRVHEGGVWSSIDMNTRNATDFDVRLSIYNEEKSEYAAVLVLGLYTKVISRKWMIRNPKRVLRTICVLVRHYGLQFTCKILFMKMCFNDRLSFDRATFIL